MKLERRMRALACHCVGWLSSTTPSAHEDHLCVPGRRGVSSAKEFGDRLRDKGAKRREALERSTSANLVRSVSSRAEATVKENVEIVRRPSQQLGSHLDTSFKGACSVGRSTYKCHALGRSQANSYSHSPCLCAGVVKEGRGVGANEGLGAKAVKGANSG